MASLRRSRTSHSTANRSMVSRSMVNPSSSTASPSSSTASPSSSTASLSTASLSTDSSQLMDSSRGQRDSSELLLATSSLQGVPRPPTGPPHRVHLAMAVHHLWEALVVVLLHLLRV